jgi:hypothetical protein
VYAIASNVRSRRRTSLLGGVIHHYAGEQLIAVSSSMSFARRYDVLAHRARVDSEELA